MATFYVGQKVRVNWPKSLFHGCETTIRTVDFYPSRFGMAHQVNIPYANAMGNYCAFHADALVPITKPDAKTLTVAEILELPNLPEFQIPAKVHV